MLRTVVFWTLHDCHNREPQSVLLKSYLHKINSAIIQDRSNKMTFISHPLMQRYLQ